MNTENFRNTENIANTAYTDNTADFSGYREYFKYCNTAVWDMGEMREMWVMGGGGMEEMSYFSYKNHFLKQKDKICRIYQCYRF